MVGREDRQGYKIPLSSFPREQREMQGLWSLLPRESKGEQTIPDSSGEMLK